MKAKKEDTLSLLDKKANEARCRGSKERDVHCTTFFFFCQYRMRRLKFAKECGVLRSAFFLASACHRSPDGPLDACVSADLDPSRFWIPYDVTHCLGMRSSLKCRKVTYKMCVAHPRKWIRFLLATVVHVQFWLIWMARICDFAPAVV